MPLKRSEALQPLSRQHHNGLLFCLLLQKGLQKRADADVMRDFIQDFWYKDLQHHFELEEVYLFPLQQRYLSLSGELNRMLAEHQLIRSVINEISLNATYQAIASLHESLNEHIRFEERHLFPLIEQTISVSETEQLSNIMGKEHDGSCINYPVKFWE